MEFVREKSLLHKLMIVDGIGKSGKSLFMDLATSFETVEKWAFHECLEFIGFAHRYHKISDDMAIAILKTEIDTALYNHMIGRNVNTRLSDDTSLYRYHSPEKYLKRALEPGGAIVYEKVLAEKPIYLCWSHDLICKSDIVFEAFGHHLEFIYLNRKPIDIIYEWDQAMYSNRMAQDPTEMQYCIKYRNTVVPHIALGWEEEYLNCTPSERTVKIIYRSLQYNYEALCVKRNLNNMHIFNFEDLLIDPMLSIERLKKIIGMPPLHNVLTTVLQRANCPRKIDECIYKKREMSIRHNISKSYATLLSDMSDMHEEIYRMATVDVCAPLGMATY